jgi:hypothetical protein
VDGQPELPRVLLTSVPYALKASDAETIAGRPLSTFVLAGETTGVGADGLTYVNPKTLSGALTGAFAPTANAGTANYYDFVRSRESRVNLQVITFEDIVLFSGLWYAAPQCSIATRGRCCDG